MKKLKILGFLLVFLFSLNTPMRAFAWGAAGHRLIVQMALSLLDPATKQNVLKALGPSYSPDLAAVWMDSVRIHHVPKYKYMNNWHFVNMENGQTYAQVANKNDVVYNLTKMINFFSHVPAGISTDSVKTNLKILCHLMGDITQPLHDGYGSDLGANKDLVTTPIYNSADNNLHHVWDDVILMKAHINLQTSTAYYQHLTASQRNTMLSGTPQSWMIQARAYLPNVYACNPSVTQVTPLTAAYLDQNASIVQQQLVCAALRLSKVLRSAFGAVPGKTS